MEKIRIKRWKSLATKWFKMEEARGETLEWSQVRQNFISDFQFRPSYENLKEAIEEVKEFITKLKDTSRIESVCRFVSKASEEIYRPSTHLALNNDNIVGKSFRLDRNHPVTTQPIRTLLAIAKEDEPQAEEVKEEGFPKSFTEIREGERYLEEKPPPECLDAEIKYKEVDISNDDRPKIAKIGDYWSQEQVAEVLGLLREF